MPVETIPVKISIANNQKFSILFCVFHSLIIHQRINPQDTNEGIYRKKSCKNDVSLDAPFILEEYSMLNCQKVAR